MKTLFYLWFPLYMICTRSFSRNFNGYFINFIAAKIIQRRTPRFIQRMKKKKISRNHKSELGRVKSFIGYSGSGSAERNPSWTSWHFTTYRRQVIIIPYRLNDVRDSRHCLFSSDSTSRDVLIWLTRRNCNKKEVGGRAMAESAKCLTPIRIHKRVYRQTAPRRCIRHEYTHSHSQRTRGSLIFKRH